MDAPAGPELAAAVAKLPLDVPAARLAERCAQWLPSDAGILAAARALLARAAEAEQEQPDWPLALAADGLAHPRNLRQGSAIDGGRKTGVKPAVDTRRREVFCCSS